MKPQLPQLRAQSVACLLCAAVLGATPSAAADRKDLKAFTPQTNFMSVNGFLRLRYLQQTGRWQSRDSGGCGVVRDQGGYTGAAPTGG